MNREHRQTFKYREFGDAFKVHVFASGQRRIVRSVVPPWHSIKRPVWIEVPSLDRFAYIKRGDPGDEEEFRPVAGGPNDAPTTREFQMYRKPPTETMLERQCDACAGPHTNKNLLCSATLGINSPYSALPPGMYDIKTRERINPDISIIDEEFSPHARVTRVTVRKLG